MDSLERSGTGEEEARLVLRLIQHLYRPPRQVLPIGGHLLPLMYSRGALFMLGEGTFAYRERTSPYHHIGTAPTVGPRAWAWTRPFRSRGVSPWIIGTPVPKCGGGWRAAASPNVMRSPVVNLFKGIPSSGPSSSTVEGIARLVPCHDTH